MATVIDNIELDETNVEFNNAFNFVKHTNRLVYLTGKAGTGKTTFLKYLRASTIKNTIILAPTGVAAINAGGQTIHSFFQIKPSVYIPNDKRLRPNINSEDSDKSTIFDHFQYSKDKVKIINELELLIIDEISMIRCDLLDVIDTLLRVFRRKKNELFGGVQVLLIGDTFQLPPVADADQWGILRLYYNNPFFFSSKVIEQNPPIYIELKKIYRQNEEEFIDILNKVRINQLSEDELNLLNSKFNPTFIPSEGSNYITLATHNTLVDGTNLTKLSELTTELKSFEAKISGLFPDNIMPTDKVLRLKEGAQIMFIKNDRTAKRYHNGKIGKIAKIENNRVTVEFTEGNRILVEEQEWNNIKYTWNEKEKKIEEEIIGTFIQLPIKLAWAITVHKSQGLTFEKVIADLGAAFVPGQVYVALSRCTTFSSLILKTKITQDAIMTAPEALRFAQNETPNTLIIQELASGKADFYYQKIRQSIEILDFAAAYDNFIKAIKLRNDIETETFKRYFIAIATRLGSFKTRLFDLAEQYDGVIEENSNFRNVNSQLSSKINSQQEEIAKQDTLIKVSVDKVKELTKQNSKEKSKNTSLTREKQVAETSIQQYQKTISELELIIKQKEQEIERLRKVKWYQKLFNPH